jgi:LuxR family maltose regulon positive regulatory protein
MTTARRTWLLHSKLSPPGISARSLPRQALIATLRGANTRAVLIDAPAGYGKTTLLEQWFHILRAEDVSAAWLTLDAHDNTPEELVPYLFSLFRNAQLLSDDTGSMESEILQSSSPRAVLATLLGHAASARRSAVFFFDDLHQLTAPGCLMLIRMLLEDSSNHFRFIIASRGRPALDVSKLEIQGTLSIVSATQLSLSRAEVALLLGPNFTNEIITGLHEKTQGWPVGLKLFLAAVPRFDDRLQELLVNLCDVPDIASYLAEQVMAHLPPDLQDFLVTTSLATCITGGLADQLCDRKDGWHILQRLEHESLFIERMDEESGWYRYFEFFREFLRNRLAQQSSINVGALHKKAAQWLLANGRAEDALRHTIEAGDWNLAIEILESEGGWHMALQHGSAALHGVDTIPEAAMQRSLLAGLSLVYLLLHFGQPDRARENFERLRKDSEDFTRWQDQEIDRPLRTECYSLEALVIVCEEKPLAVDFVERIKADALAIGFRGRFVRILAESSLSIYAHYDAGLYRECIRLAEEGVVALQGINADFGLGYLYIYLGMSHFALGELWLAQSWYQKAFDLAATRFPHESLRLEALACIAEVQYYKDELETARKNIAAVFDGLKRQTAVDGAVFQVAYVTGAALYARAEDLNSALSLLMEARTVARYLQREHRLAHIEIRRVEELTRAGYYADAAEVIQQEGFQRALNKRDDPANIALLAMNASLALARFELVTGDVAAAHNRLTNLHFAAESGQNEVIKLKCLTLLAAARFAHGDRDASMQCLRSLFSRIIPLGLKRVVADEKSLIEPAIDYLLEKGERSQTVAYANAQIIAEQWLNLRAEVPPSSQPTLSELAREPLTPPSVLSPRQREVLELLAAGLSGKEIATRLALSESTVKSYRKTLYAKLHAGRRSQALANARRMSLLV